MSDKFDEYNDILTRLVRETIACTPSEWTKGTLTIDCDGTRINYSLRNPDQPNAALISEKLRDLIDEFYVRMARRGEAWTEAVVSFSREGGSVKFDTEFSYATSQRATEAPAKSKSRWKFW